MASQELKHRTGDEPIVETDMDNKTNKARRSQKRTAMAKRGLRSLAIAVALPLPLTLANIYLFWSNTSYSSGKPFWFPPLWALHLTCVLSAFLMALSAWLVWAEGGFHRNPNALVLYVVQLALALAWDPIVLLIGPGWVALAVCLATVGTLVACSQVFREVNPIAGDLVLACLAWAVFLSGATLTLVYV